MPVDTTALEAGLRAYALRLMDQLGERFVEGARGRCSRRTGTLADSIEASGAVDGGSRITNTVRCGAEYGRYQDEGTGIYGPDGARIVPTNAKVLAFDWAAGGGMTFRASVAGSPGTHFWSDTIDDWPNIVASV